LLPIVYGLCSKLFFVPKKAGMAVEFLPFQQSSCFSMWEMETVKYFFNSTLSIDSGKAVLEPKKRKDVFTHRRFLSGFTIMH